MIYAMHMIYTPYTYQITFLVYHIRPQMSTIKDRNNAVLALVKGIILSTIGGKGEGRYMVYMEKTIRAGRYLEMEWYPVTETGKRIPIRREKTGESREAQKKLNAKNRKKQLTRLLHTNFTEEDIFVTLTYETSIPEEQARKEIANFLRRLRDYRKRRGMAPLVYVEVTEKAKRIHHHLVIKGGIPWDELKRIWGKGRITASNLEFDPETGLEGLANYLLKEEKAKGEKHWRQSKNIRQPEIKTRIAQKPNAYRKPRPKPGYRILHIESIENEISGSYRYIRMVKKEERNGGD